VTKPADPAEQVIGERLFRETRFAQHFSTHFKGSFNEPLAVPDPIMELTLTLGTPLEGPFKGKSMNCAACHMVDDHLDTEGGGMRSYADFARRSPIPIRGDGRLVAPRNSPPLVNSALPRGVPLLFHFDGEFESMPALVAATLTGRNYGWLPQENTTAKAHIVQVVKNDLGQDDLAKEFAPFPYRALFSGNAEDLPEELHVPERFRIDVEQANDDEIFAAVTKFIAAYVEGLVFSQDEMGQYNASPYDKFLEINGLPRKPAEGESDLEYSRRLLAEIEKREVIEYVVSGKDGSLQFHDQNFTFGPTELSGLKIFFAEVSTPLAIDSIESGKIGNCIACHAAPNFTDFGFHNTGAAQEEYDKTHGEGSFQALFIPELAERNENATAYLPPNPKNTNGSGIFMSIPSLDAPGHTDLGLWNVFGNPSVPGPQEALLQAVCRQHPESPCSAEALLPATIAQFKTPGLRDLGHSSPYMHTGEMAELEDVMKHYLDFSNRARSETMRNSPKEFEGMALKETDFEPLVRFLQALNEDYE
jgi:cytochrome c peroxidase